MNPDFHFYRFQIVAHRHLFFYFIKKTKKADQKHYENSRRESGSELNKIPRRASEVSGRNSFEISSLKVCNKPTLAPMPFRAFFGLQGPQILKSLEGLKIQKSRFGFTPPPVQKIKKETNQYICGS